MHTMIKAPASFAAIKADASKFNERNDCSIKAVAFACNVDYLTAHDALRRAGRRNRQGATTTTIHRAVADLGFVVQELKRPRYSNDVYRLDAHRNVKTMRHAGCILNNGVFIKQPHPSKTIVWRKEVKCDDLAKALNGQSSLQL